MSSYQGRAGRAALALLRTALVAVIFVSEQLVEARQLADLQFFLVLSLATGYTFVGVALAMRSDAVEGMTAFTRLQPICDVSFLVALTYTSGGAYSDVRKAFFVIPLAAAFSERPRSTAEWSLLAVTAFSLQAALARGRPAGAVNSWVQMTVNQDLYLAWTGAAATMLATALRRRSAEIQGLAQSRQRLVTQAIEAVERERTRLAGALHDSPVQNLMAARHDLRRAQLHGDAESFDRLHEAIDATIAELREEIFNLHPHVLDHVGLAAALDQVARRHARNGELTVTVEADAEADAAHRLVLFGIGRELLGNAAKHAGASEVRLSLARNRSDVTLVVSDDGRGIPEGRLRQALLDGHIGLAAVRERVVALGGMFSISTAPESGTSIRVTLPVAVTQEHRATLRGWHVQPTVSRPEASDRVTSGATLGVSTG